MPILNIETKENSPEKLAAIAGKETKFFLMAEEFNEVVGTINAIDNVRKEILISCPGTITPLAFADLINALPSFEIGHNDFITFKAVSTDAEPITYYVELLNLGKGSYGIDGIVLTSDNIKVTAFGANSADISELSTTQIIDLGYMGTDVSTALNIQLPNIDIQDQSEGYVIIKGIFAGGEFHEYLWLGVAGTYGGAGGLQSTDVDFKELSAVSGGYTKSEVDGLLLGKEEKSNKTATVIGNEASVNKFLNIAGAVTYFQQKLTDVVFGAFQSVLPTVTTVADTDKVPFLIGSLSRMMTWANFKVVLKTYFDSQYKTDVMPFALSDPYSVLVIGDVDTFQAPCNFTLVNYWIAVKTAPTVSSLIVDIKKNGVSITSTKAGIDATEKNSLTGTSPVLTTTSFVKGDEITPTIFQIGSGESGRSLKIYLEVIKA